MTIRIWQEYDCPECLIDFDLGILEILARGESCYCPGCGGRHTAGPGDVVNQTYVIGADGVMHVRGIPESAAEKAAWIAEAKLSELGIAPPQTEESFKRLVDAIDSSTEAGRQLRETLTKR